MSYLKNRIEKLEKQTRASKPERKTVALIWPPDEETVAKAIAEAIRLGITPDMIGGPEPIEDCNIVRVNSERAKKLTERIIAGEGTEWAT